MSRIHTLDLLRGFALLGILLMNITSFSQVGMAYMNPHIGAGIEGYNRYFWDFNYLFADTRFMSLFSILFGAGVLLFARNATAKGNKAWALHYKRMFWLLIFGFIHAYLIWMGDILVSYSICGALAFLFRNASFKTLWIVGSIFFVVPMLLSASTYYGMPPDELEEFFAFYHTSPAVYQEKLEIMASSYLEQMPERIHEAIELQTIVFAIDKFWRIMSMMLLGMILFRKGILSNEHSESYYGKMAIWGIGVGFVISAFGLFRAYENGWQAGYIMNVGSNYNYVASILMALGYIGLVNWWYKKGVFVGLQQRLQAVGRMAFTNYILTSIICTFIFNGHGLGYIGQVDRLEMFLIVFGVWGFLLLLSPWVLRHYRYGPLEWLWRKLTYYGQNR